MMTFLLTFACKCSFLVIIIIIISSSSIIITSLAKEVMFLVVLVSLSVCLFVCLSVDITL